MSYILDALQRAEAERERAGVPGLHARPVPPTASSLHLSGRRRAALATLGVIALGVVAGGLWGWRAPVAIPVAVPVAVPVAEPAPLKHATSMVATLPTVTRPVAPQPVAPPAPAARATDAGTHTAVNIPLLSELPQDIRIQIPALTITGAVYSENPAQRLLLLNAQVLSQGSLAAPDVTLERIGATHSEFSFRGTRFRMAH